jgi:hypothetical protein
MEPMRPALQRAVAIAVSLLVLLGGGVLALRAGGLPIAQGPAITQAASPSPAASAPATPGQPAASSSPADPATVLATIEAQVRALRGLPAAPIGPPRIITTAQLAEDLRGRFERDDPPAQQAADNLELHALGLLSPSQDAAALQLELLTAQVAGYYDPDAKQMVIVSDAGLTPLAEVTYAHEYTHALQDAAFGLASLRSNATGDTDLAMARTALIEGDATLTMLLWALQHLSPLELAAITETPIPQLPDVPAWMTQQLEWPYLGGAQFVSALYAAGGGSVGLGGTPDPAAFAGVDAAFRSPPDTTEQVLHPGTASAPGEQVLVAAPHITAATGWATPITDTLGEAMIEIWLEGVGVPAATAQGAAAGWGGDRLAVSSGGDGSFVLGWTLAWGSAADADEFVAAYGTARESLTLNTRVERLSSTEVLVVQASQPALLARVAPGS